MAGANISGDLENPSENIPKGTMYAVVVSIIVYLIMAICLGCVTAREGEAEDSGLHGNTLIMTEISAWGPLIYAGIYAATFTSALASLVGAPRVLQKVASDEIIPALNFFKKVRESDGAPVRGYYAAYFVSLCCIAIGSLNAVAPLITQFFMITYALINFSVFMLEVYRSPGWRPSFTMFNKWTALLGTFFCVFIMFLTEPISAVVAFIIAFGIYFYISRSDPDINWGTAMQSQSHVNAIESILRMRKDNSHIKNFRPNILIHVGAPDDRKHLLYFGQTLREFKSMMVYINISIGDYRVNMADYRRTHLDGYVQSGVTIGRDGKPIPEQPKVKGLFDSVLASDFRTGNHMALQLCGLGALKPNTVCLGYKEEWWKDDKKKGKGKNEKPTPTLDEYVGMITDSFAMGMGVMVCRHMESINWKQDSIYTHGSEVNLEEGVGTIDVWWLRDDGGLSILIPHIMSQHKFWRNPPAKDGVMESVLPTARECNIRLLIPTRVVDVAEVKRLSDTFTNDLHLNIHVEPVALEDESDFDSPMGMTIRHEVDKYHSIKRHKRPDATERWMRIAELIRENSQKAKMVYMTCPLPRPDISPEEYMTLLEVVSKVESDLSTPENPSYVPSVLIRGAAKELYLTYYLE